MFNENLILNDSEMLLCYCQNNNNIMLLNTILLLPRNGSSGNLQVTFKIIRKLPIVR